jgi:hypothetical protein
MPTPSCVCSWDAMRDHRESAGPGQGTPVPRPIASYRARRAEGRPIGPRRSIDGQRHERPVGRPSSSARAIGRWDLAPTIQELREAGRESLRAPEHPTDMRDATWSRLELLQMNARFVAAMERALDQERRHSAEETSGLKISSAAPEFLSRPAFLLCTLDGRSPSAPPFTLDCHRLA